MTSPSAALTRLHRFDAIATLVQTQSMLAPLPRWQTSAINLPEHADNPVHTDEGARAAGFDGALVAGTTVHAYLTHSPAAAWGASWLDHGWSELRLIAPVMDHDLVTIGVANDADGDPVIEARVDGELRATLAVATSAPAPVERTVIERHPDLTIDLAEGLGMYGLRAGDDLEIYQTDGRAHPSAWSCIGNTVTKMHHVDGPWVHVRSAITHHGPAASDDVVTVRSSLVERFETRAGERVVLDIEITSNGEPIARVEHESIVRLR